MTIERGGGSPVSGIASDYANLADDETVTGDWLFSNGLSIGPEGARTQLKSSLSTVNLVQMGPYFNIESNNTSYGGLYFNQYTHTSGETRRIDAYYAMDVQVSTSGVRANVWNTSTADSQIVSGDRLANLNLTATNADLVFGNYSGGCVGAKAAEVYATMNGAYMMSLTSGGAAFGDPTGSYQGAGTINCEGIYVNGVSVSGGASQVEYTGSVNLAAAATSVLNLTHGLGTDDVSVRIIAKSVYSGSKIDDYIISWARPDGLGGVVRGAGNPTWDIQITAAPSAGDVKVTIKNTYTLTQDITYSIIITDISGVSAGP